MPEWGAFFLLWLVGTVWGVVVFEDGVPLRTTTVAAVSSTTPGTSEPSPAVISGVAVDDIITATDGVAIGTWDEFGTFAETHGGQDVVISVSRDGVALDLSATLAVIDRPIIADGDFVFIRAEAEHFAESPYAGKVQRVILCCPTLTEVA